MNAEDLTLNKCGNSKIVEHFCAIFPRVGVTVLSDNFIVKSIDGGNLSAFMISSKESNSSWVHDFVSH